MTKAFDSALRMLAAREHSAFELSNKLEQKGYGRVEIKDALEACQRLDLQSDSRFVAIYSRSRIRQGYGPLKILQELKIKGIDNDLIHEVFLREEEDWLSRAMDVWSKKSRGQLQLSANELAKMQRFLLYRGFNMDIITQVVREVKSSAK